MHAIAREEQVSVTVADGIYQGQFTVTGGLLTVISTDGRHQASIKGFEGRLDALARVLLFELYLLHQQQHRRRH